MSHVHFTRSLLRAPLAAGAGLLAIVGSCIAADPQIPGDDGNLVGDHLQLRTNVSGFKPVGAGDNTATKCAPAGSRLSVSAETESVFSVRFLSVPAKEELFTTASDRLAIDACAQADRVNTHTQYVLPRNTLSLHEYKRTGVTFGGLLVPFKYRLGGAKELVASSAIAPFIGFRSGWLQTFGLTFTPVMAAGLSLVPVIDAQGQSSTASAYTFALGLRLTSTKNEAFSAGLLYGRDFLNRAERDANPNVKKPWFSFYVGYAV